MGQVGTQWVHSGDVGCIGISCNKKIGELRASVSTMGNSYGTLFRITTFGESHGAAIGVIIDGCPAGLEIDEGFIQHELERRKPGQSRITTQRKEDDVCKILSGVFEGKSTGTPIAMVIENTDQ